MENKVKAMESGLQKSRHTPIYMKSNPKNAGLRLKA